MARRSRRNRFRPLKSAVSTNSGSGSNNSTAATTTQSAATVTTHS